MATYLTDIKNKYAAITDEAVESLFLYKYNTVVNKHTEDGSVECHSIPEGIRPVFVLRIFYTVNRHWLMITLQRLKDAGLVVKWKEKLNWVFETAKKCKSREL